MAITLDESGDVVGADVKTTEGIHSFCLLMAVYAQ